MPRYRFCNTVATSIRSELKTYDEIQSTGFPIRHFGNIWSTWYVSIGSDDTYFPDYDKYLVEERLKKAASVYNSRYDAWFFGLISLVGFLVHTSDAWDILENRYMSLDVHRKKLEYYLSIEKELELTINCANRC
jgi:hypothetical protein